jgi:spore germination cell wall hydrolase CwlJ-like protein
MKRTILLSVLIASGSVHAMWTEDAHGNTIKPRTTKSKPQSYAIEITFNDTRAVVKPSPKTIATMEPIKPGELAVDHKGKKIAGQTDKDVNCLAYSIFREAGNLNENAQLAVGQVHVNRLNEGTWGDRMCQVVYAPHQFSWTDEQKVVKWSENQREKFVAEAKSLMNGLRVKKLAGENILNYHADYVAPRWAKQGQVVAKAGPHIFYKNIPY